MLEPLVSPPFSAIISFQLMQCGEGLTITSAMAFTSCTLILHVLISEADIVLSRCLLDLPNVHSTRDGYAITPLFLDAYLTPPCLDINAVERVVEYLDLPQEPPAVMDAHRPPAFWPSSSAEKLVEVSDLVIKYAPELEPVINGVSFTLQSGERVGLVGRTGSGKSTLAMAFLRFVDPTMGKIVIDGIDITTIGLRDLRSRLVCTLLVSSSSYPLMDYVPSDYYPSGCGRS